MEIFQHSLFLFLGLVFIVKGADFLVEGASSLAKKLKISEMVIGLTIVAFGTSLPELIVNIFASIQGKNEIVFGNIIGSNIFNILLILGISGLIYPLKYQKNTIWKEIPFIILGIVLLFFFTNNNGVFKEQNNINRLEGILFIGLFLIFLLYVLRISKIKIESNIEIKEKKQITITIYIILGLTGLFFGGKWVVENAVIIAKNLGVSNKLIALTIVSAGTSLPELATSAVAAYKKKSDIAIGNIVGSNIFNIFMILGVSALIKPITFNFVFNHDIFILFIACIFLFVTNFTGKKKILDRWEAFLFLMIYIGYISFIIIRK